METLDKLLELDDKHNKLLEQLAQLDARITETLNEWGAGTAQPSVLDSVSKSSPTSRIKAA